eukprot:TRINITY_DN2781_c0_g1_i1.p1 TRINITY_DN2781_c0_g1~~TRINITY_DN2781_c0_g1_i1.p1  ORF type:complete len:467 (-),score=86.00 TRINITY_DN2781_c0_g1_i1:1949-3349(-)
MQETLITVCDSSSSLIRQRNSLQIGDPNHIRLFRLPSSVILASLFVRSLTDPAALVAQQTHQSIDLSVQNFLDKQIKETVFDETGSNTLLGVDGRFVLLSSGDGSVVIRPQTSTFLTYAPENLPEEFKEDPGTSQLIHFALNTEKTDSDHLFELYYSLEPDIISWFVDYVLHLDEPSQTFTFSANLSIRNKTDVDFKNARLKFTRPIDYEMQKSNNTEVTKKTKETYGKRKNKTNSRKHKFHLETQEFDIPLSPPLIDLPKDKTFTTSIFRKEGIPFVRRFLFNNQFVKFTGTLQVEDRYNLNSSTQSFPAIIELDNNVQNGLGFNLPAGNLAVHKTRRPLQLSLNEVDTKRQFLWTKPGETIDLNIGQSTMGLFAERTRVDLRKETRPPLTLTESFSVRLKNEQYPDPVHFVVEESCFRTDVWQVERVTAGIDYRRSGPHHCRFYVTIPFGVERTFVFTIVYTTA